MSPLWDGKKRTPITALPKGLLRVEVSDEGPGLPRADPSLSIGVTVPKHRDRARHRYSTVQGKQGTVCCAV